MTPACPSEETTCPRGGVVRHRILVVVPFHRHTPASRWEHDSRATASDISVIGRCSVASCGRPATVHIALAGPDGVAGSVCDRCRRMSSLAGFLLELMAA